MGPIFGGQHRQAVANAQGKGPGWGSPAGNFQTDPPNHNAVTMGNMFSQMRRGNQGPGGVMSPNPQDVAPPGNMGPPQGQFSQKPTFNQGPDPFTGPTKTPYPQLLKAMLGGASMTGPQNVYSPMSQRRQF